MNMTVEQAKSAILQAFVAKRLKEVTSELRAVKSTQDGIGVGPTTKQIADHLGVNPPRVTRNFNPLISEGASSGIVGGVREGGYQWWYDGLLDDLVQLKPEMAHVVGRV